VTRADRGGVLNRGASGPSRGPIVQGLVMAAALLALVLAAPTSSSPTPELQRAGHPVVIHAQGADLGELMATRPSEHRTQASTWPAWGAGAEPALLLSSSVLLAGLLLGLSDGARSHRRSPRSLPRRRGPPQLAFTH
jgi:hypothetical protein